MAAGTLDHEGLPAEQCDQRGRAKAAKQEPCHAAHADPPEEREPDRAEYAELNTLLGKPRGHGIHQFAIEEEHLEHRDRDFNEDHEDDVAGLARLDRLIQHLNAREAAGDDDREENPEDEDQREAVDFVAREVREQLAHRGPQREREDRRLDRGPDDEEEERRPGNAGTARRRVEDGERRRDRSLYRAHHEPRAQLDEAPHPPDEHHQEAREAGPVEPHHTERVPPGQRHRLQERHRSSQAERNGVEGHHRPPDAGDEHGRRQQQQNGDAGEPPEVLALEDEAEHTGLERHDPR